MIRFLAKLFRGLHGIIGITAPPAGQSERSFVLLWVGILVLLLAFCGFMAYATLYLF